MYAYGRLPGTREKGEVIADLFVRVDHLIEIEAVNGPCRVNEEIEGDPGRTCRIENALHIPFAAGKLNLTDDLNHKSGSCNCYRT